MRNGCDSVHGCSEDRPMIDPSGGLAVSDEAVGALARWCRERKKPFLEPRTQLFHAPILRIDDDGRDRSA